MNTCNRCYTRKTWRCKTSQTRPRLVLYYVGPRLDRQRCCNQVHWLPPAISRPARNGYALIFKERLLHCRPKPICICQEERHCTNTTLTKMYTFKQNFLYCRWIFVYKLLLASDLNTASGMATASYNKLQHRENEPFCTVKAHPHTVAIDRYGASIAVSIHLVGSDHEPENIHHATGPRTTQLSNASQTTSKTPRQQRRKAAENRSNQAKRPKEWGTKKIVGHKGHGQGRRNIVRRYIY